MNQSLLFLNDRTITLQEICFLHDASRGRRFGVYEGQLWPDAIHGRRYQPYWGALSGVVRATTEREGFAMVLWPRAGCDRGAGCRCGSQRARRQQGGHGAWLVGLAIAQPIGSTDLNSRSIARGRGRRFRISPTFLKARPIGGLEAALAIGVKTRTGAWRKQ
jgi:hypothetical protein